MENQPDPTQPPQHIDFGPAYLVSPRQQGDSGSRQDAPSGGSTSQGNTAPARIIEFVPAQVVVLKPQSRADQERPADTSATADSGMAQPEVAQPARAQTTDSKNDRPEQIIKDEPPAADTSSNGDRLLLTEPDRKRPALDRADNLAASSGEAENEPVGGPAPKEEISTFDIVVDTLKRIPSDFMKTREEREEGVAEVYMRQGHDEKEARTMAGDYLDAAGAVGEAAGASLGRFPTSKLFGRAFRVRGKGGRGKLMRWARNRLRVLQRAWIKKRIKELRDEGHSDDYIRRTIRGQIDVVGLDMFAKSFNEMIENALKKP